MKATEIGSQTLIGHIGPYPQHGNCFSILAEDGNDYWIVNFGVEDLREVVKRNLLSLPVNIEPIEGKYQGRALAVIQDDRIPAEWYKERYCRACCK